LGPTIREVALPFIVRWCMLVPLVKTKVIKLDPHKPEIARIREAAALVDAGGLVAFPTETVYGIACRVKEDSLAKLDNLKGRTPDKRYTLHIGQKSEITKYVPTIALKARKLMKNAWPGPLTIIFELNEQDLLKQQSNLHRQTFESLYKDGSIGIRCPDSPIASIFLRLVCHPVVAPSANITGQEPATEPEQVLSQFSGQIDLLLDAGPCKYKKSSTVVKIGKTGLEILRKGVYSQADLEALSTVRFLFVCTGNTCRSAMAEGIFRKYLAKKLQCDVDQLDRMGYKISSAGIMKMSAAPASAEAVVACKDRGIDIKKHKSNILSPQLIEESDFIFAMEQIHCDRVRAFTPEAADKCTLLAENKEIADPIGQPQEFFNRCAEMIENAVRRRIDEIVI